MSDHISISQFLEESFTLSEFQEKAIAAIQDNKHCLITAHTGSGKTLPAELAIQYFTSHGKKVIYTSPIKALSNQKLHDFRLKYPHISFGIVTGDIEDNKEAQVLIMTTEILANALFNRKTVEPNTTSAFHFEMDYDNDLAAVVFDEVHYICDPDRGVAWEQCMIQLPKHVLMIMLSATIANPNLLCNWIENISKKPVVLCPTTERVVPLHHYLYLPNIGEKNFKKLPQSLQSKIQPFLNNLIPIKQGEGKTFDLETYQSLYNATNEVLAHTRFDNSLVSAVKYLRTHNMLPALCFVFSRARVEELAKSTYGAIGSSLFSEKELSGHDMSKTIAKECRHLLASKLPNFSDFLDNAECQLMITLLSKGIAFHHAGMMPVLRELVELLDEKGYVKLLFATETFAVGVNMPTKTVLFSKLQKRSTEGNRHLLPHEYTQMAGRAGRRGIDTKGHCIILPEAMVSPHSMKSILSGSPLSVTSNYKITYQMVLGIIKDNNNLPQDKILDIVVSKSQDSLSAPSQLAYANKLATEIQHQKESLVQLEEKIKEFKTPMTEIQRYMEIEKLFRTGMLAAKSQRKLKSERYKLCERNFQLERDASILESIQIQKSNLCQLEEQHSAALSYLYKEVSACVALLKEFNCLTTSQEPTNTELYISHTGLLASNIFETHPLVLANYTTSSLYNLILNDTFNAIDLASRLSIFCDASTRQDDSNQDDGSSNEYSQEATKMFKTLDHAYQREHEVLGGYYISQEYHMSSRLCKHVADWCKATTSTECRAILDNVYNTAGVSTGDFVKSLLKIVKLSKELMNSANEIGSSWLRLEKLCSEIPELLMKYVVTNQSLYI